jgi:hypothetical protein
VLANVIWIDGVAGLPPWFLGRAMRERTATGQAARERAERIDAEREYHVRAAAPGEGSISSRTA